MERGRLRVKEENRELRDREGKRKMGKGSRRGR